MILVTGATGYIGRRLLPWLHAEGGRVRILLRPRPKSPRLPTGLALEVALTSLADLRGVRAAMVGVDRVIHLASAAADGPRGDLYATDVAGTENVVQAAADASVRQIVFLSHLGASRASAYPLLRAKALAEEHIRNSGLPHLILRCGPIFGPGDRFLTRLAMMLAASPVVLPIPGEGAVQLHPLWLEDLVTALQWLLDDPEAKLGTHEVGGPEHLSLRRVIDLVAETTGYRRIFMPMRPAYMRGLVWLLERMMPHPPLTTNALDYLAANRTAPLDSMIRLAGLQPARLADRIGFLEEGRWGWQLMRRQLAVRGAP